MVTVLCVSQRLSRNKSTASWQTGRRKKSTRTHLDENRHTVSVVETVEVFLFVFYHTTNIVRWQTTRRKAPEQPRRDAPLHPLHKTIALVFSHPRSHSDSFDALAPTVAQKPVAGTHTTHPLFTNAATDVANILAPGAQNLTSTCNTSAINSDDSLCLRRAINQTPAREKRERRKNPQMMSLA